MITICLAIILFNELTDLYSRLSNTTLIAQHAYQDQVRFQQRQIRQIADVMDLKHLGLTYPFEVVVHDQYGKVNKELCNFKYDFLLLDFAQDNMIYNQLTASKKLTDDLYITLIQTMDLATLDQLKHLYITYQQYKARKTSFYIIIACLLFVYCLAFIGFIWYRTHRLRSRIVVDLNKLLVTLAAADTKPHITEFSVIFDKLINSTLQLQEQHALVTTIIENISSGVLLADHDGRTLIANRLADQYLSEYDIDLSNTLAIDGNRRFTIHQQVLGVNTLYVIEDVTNKIMLEKQIAWTEVARVVAHEVKNPLTPIRLAAQMLESCPEKAQQYSRTIINSVDQIAGILARFTDFVAPLLPTYTDCRLDILIQELIAVYDQAMFILDLSQTVIQADVQLMRQMLLNLIQNALESSDKPTVRINWDGVRLVIHDNGSGLSIGQEQLFQPYTTTKKHGTGLGLAIVKKIIQAHFWNITIENDHGCKCIITCASKTDIR